jgi:Zn-dependent peptidase ImmA (M78 family)
LTNPIQSSYILPSKGYRKERFTLFFTLIYLLEIKGNQMKKELNLKSNVYTAKTLAEEWGVSKRLIHYFRQTGKLKPITSGTARFYYKKEDVEDFLREKGYE